MKCSVRQTERSSGIRVLGGAESDKMAVDRPQGSGIVKGSMIAERFFFFWEQNPPPGGPLGMYFLWGGEWSSSAGADIHWVHVERAARASAHDRCVDGHSKGSHYAFYNGLLKTE